MAENCVLREDKNGVYYLALNRPETLNALDSARFRTLEVERYGLANYCVPEDVLWEEAEKIRKRGARNAIHRYRL